VHLEKMKKDHDDLELQNQASAKKIEAWSQKCNKLIKAPVLNVIGADFTEARVEAPKIGLVEKSQKAWGWLQQWTKDIREYVGAHVLSLVRAHYPLMDIARLEAGYPKEVGVE
jgi:hypothetical protein